MSQVRFVEDDKVFHTGRQQACIFVSYHGSFEEAMVKFGDGDYAIVTVHFLELVK